MAPPDPIKATALSSELDFSYSRSGGPGGQNVNKVNSKVTLKFDVHGSRILSEEQKSVLVKKLKTKLTTDGILILTSQDKRSQLQNKESVVLKFEDLISKAFKKTKPRKATKPSRKSVENRLNSKKQKAEKKKWRLRPL